MIPLSGWGRASACEGGSRRAESFLTVSRLGLSWSRCVQYLGAVHDACLLCVHARSAVNVDEVNTARTLG